MGPLLGTGDKPEPPYNRCTVPLSDREQKILEEIEKNLHDEDPRLAREVSGSTRTNNTGNIKLGILIFFVGLALLIGFFLSGVLLVGVLAFGTMVTGLFLAAGALGGMAASGMSRRERLAGAFSDWERRMRERYKRR